MSNVSPDLLRLLYATHAFDPVAQPGSRTVLYVPFEELVGGSHESRLETEIENTHRVALIGPIGSGKSSMVEYVLRGSGDRFAAIWISAGHEGPETLRDPPEFARHVIREVVGWARDAKQMTEDERQDLLIETSAVLPGRASKHRQSLSLTFALNWISPGWSDEVEETLADPDVERNRGDFVDSLSRLFELIHDRLGRSPVVIIDDSDRWLRLEEGDRETLLEAFFTDTCRMLAELNCAIVIAVHPDYCAAAPFRSAAANGYLSVQLDVPRLEEPQAIRTLFERRIQAVASAAEEERLLEAGIDPQLATSRFEAEASVDDVFEEGFEAVLLECYAASDSNLRSVLTIAQQALQETIDLEERVVTTAALRDVALSLAT
jgi:hypothetical protein